MGVYPICDVIFGVNIYDTGVPDDVMNKGLEENKDYIEISNEYYDLCKYGLGFYKTNDNLYICFTELTKK